MKLAFKIGGHNTFQNTENARNGGKDKNRILENMHRIFISFVQFVKWYVSNRLIPTYIPDTHARFCRGGDTHRLCLLFIASTRPPQFRCGTFPSFPSNFATLKK